MTDEHLEHAVTQAMLNRRELSSQPIEVIASNGVITLRGTVQSHSRKLIAHQVALATERVTDVVNELQVGSCTTVTDSAIAQGINSQFEKDHGIAGHSIIVGCHDGKVKLTGYIRDEQQKVRASDLAQSVNGVTEVINLLLVNPDGVETNLRHCQKLLEEIRQTIGLQDSNIQVAVVDDTARLSGLVDAIWKKEAAEMITRKRKIKKVGNEIVVRQKT